MKVKIILTKDQIDILRHLIETKRLECHTNSHKEPSYQSKEMIPTYNELLNVLYLFKEEDVIL